MVELKNIVNNRQRLKESGWYENSLAVYWASGKKQEAIDYLIYAKTCEPHALTGNGRYNEWYTDYVDSLAMEELSKMGARFYHDSDDDFLKARYAFQSIRMAHYVSDYEQVINLYELMVGEDAERSLIYWWTRSHYAGALQRSARHMEASYHFAQVMANCKSRRLPAYFGFYIEDEAAWQACLSLCETDEEKAAVWFMAGMEPYSYSLDAFEAIADLDINSEFLDILLSRELNKVEEKFYEPREDWGYERPSEAYIQELSDFVYEIAESDRVQRKYFWYFGSGYMAYMAGNYSRMDSMFAIAEQMDIDHGIVSEQIYTISILRKIDEVEVINKAFEDEIGEDLSYLSEAASGNYDYVDNAYNVALIRLQSLYSEHDQFKTMLLTTARSDIYYDCRYDPSTVDFDGLYELMNSDELTGLEGFLLDRFPYGEYYLREIHGTYLIGENELEEAKAIFDQLPDDYEQVGAYRYFRLPYDPFEFHAWKYPDENGDTASYTKQTYVDQMLEWKEVAKNDKKNALEAHMNLGIGYWSVSRWGRCWMAADYWKSGHYSCDPSESWSWYGGDYTNCNLYNADYHFEEAYQLAKKKKDLELSARILYMKAYVEAYNDGHYFPEENSPSFDVIKDDYESTNFYAFVIKECSHYRDYFD